MSIVEAKITTSIKIDFNDKFIPRLATELIL